MRSRHQSASSRRGLSFLEITIGTVIFAIASIPLYNVLSMGLRGVERTRDHMLAYAVAEKISEELNEMIHDASKRQSAIDFATPSPEPITSVPFFPALKASVEAAVLAAPGAKTGDAAQAVQALSAFKYSVESKAEKPAGAPQALWVSKTIRVYWPDSRGKTREIQLDASFSNSEIYFQVVKDNYRNAKSVTDRIMQDIANKRSQPLVKYDRNKLKEELRAPLKSNEFIDPNPWYDGFIAQANVSVRKRLGTQGSTSDERMAVKEAALAQFFGLTKDEARVRTYDLKNEDEEIVKKVENLPAYSDVFANLKGVEGVGVRSPGKPGAYSCLNCHSPEFLATIDEGYLSIPKEYLAFKADGKTGEEWLVEYLQALRDNKAITEAEFKKFTGNLKSKDCGTCSGSTSSTSM